MTSYRDYNEGIRTCRILLRLLEISSQTMSWKAVSISPVDRLHSPQMSNKAGINVMNDLLDGEHFNCSPLRPLRFL